MFNYSRSRKPFIMLAVLLTGAGIYRFTLVSVAQPTATHSEESLTVKQLTVAPGDGTQLVFGRISDFGAAGIRVLDQDGRTRLAAGIVPANGSQPTVILYDTNEKPRLFIGLNPDGCPLLQGASKEEKIQFALGACEDVSTFELRENGIARLRLFSDSTAIEGDSKKASPTTIPTQPRTGSLILYDEQGRKVRAIP